MIRSLIRRRWVTGFHLEDGKPGDGRHREFVWISSENPRCSAPLSSHRASASASSTRASLDPWPAGRAPAASSGRPRPAAAAGRRRAPRPRSPATAAARPRLREAGGRSPGRRRPPPRRGHRRRCRVTTVRSVSRMAIGASGWPPVTSATRAASARAPPARAVGAGSSGACTSRRAAAVGGGGARERPARGQLEVPALVGAAGAPPQRDLAGGEPPVGGVEVGGGQVVQHRRGRA